MTHSHRPQAGTDYYSGNALSRRAYLKGMLACVVSGTAAAGCAAHRERRRLRQLEKAECADAGCQVQRRFFVSPQGPVGVNGVAGGFARELAAEINTQPCCSAILLPVDFPVDAPPQLPPGPSPELQKLVDNAGPSPGVDFVLIVHVTEVVAFRPMRISAILEKRMLADGSLVNREHRTWNAPLDLDPLDPHPLNRLLLNHPPPTAATELHELNRLSPLTFQHSVAQEVAMELAKSPI